ncbi:MAG: ATP-binding protein [Victivallaceae bacterium]
MFISRTLETAFLEASKFFPAVLVTGPRQVGKTTFLCNLREDTRKYVTLDNMLDCSMARNDPQGFLARYSPPVLIDEIQYAPELLPYIKIMIDNARQTENENRHGMFWLTGSQQFHLMKGVTESLAGRVGIVDLLGFSQSELTGRHSEPFLPDIKFHVDSVTSDVMELYRRIWTGAFPEIVMDNGEHWTIFYSSYLRTYLERDVRDLSNIGDLEHFTRFLRAVAARTGQILNYSDLARDADITMPTAKAWLSILKTSGLVWLLESYFNNITKRMIKAPKLFMLDTGLCAFLTGWSSPKVLEAGAMAGAIFETWCFTEILKSYLHNGRSQVPFYFYRDKDKREIDLLIEQNGTLYPVEFKKSASAKLDDARHFKILEQIKKPVGTGAIICMYPELVQLSPDCRIIPAPLL